jgi:PAS domain S-box-containing protein
MNLALRNGADAFEVSRFSDEHLHLAIEAAGLGLWFWNLKTNDLIWNDQCKALFGLASDTTITYEVFLSAIHPDDRARTEDTIHAAIRGCGAYLIEYRSLWPDGTIHWLVARGRVDSDETGQPATMMGVAGDISERKRTEEELRRNEEKLSISLEAAQMGTWEWTADGHAVSLSPLSAEVFGLRPGELFRTSDDGFNLLHPDDRARHQALFERASTSGEDFSTEYRVIRPRDGKVAWIAERGRASCDPITGAIRLRGVHWDITERKLAEERLRENEQRWRRFMDSNIIGLAIAGPGGIIDANRIYLEMLGCRPEEFKPRKLHWRDFTPPEYHSRDDEARLQVLSEGVSRPYEKEYVRQDGTRLPVMIGATLLTSEPPTWASFCIDMSEHKRAEARARETDRQLRLLVQTAPVYLFRVSPDLKIEYVSPSGFDAIGRPPAVISILPAEEGETDLADLIHRGDLERIRELWRDAVASLTQISYEFRLLVADGTYRWIAARAAPELDSSGRLHCFHGASFDIHAQKEAETALHERDRQLRALTDAAPVYLYKLLPNLTAEYITQYFFDFTGARSLHSDDGKLLPLDEVVHPDDQQMIRQAWNDAIAGRAKFSFEFRLRRRDGAYRWFLTRAQPEYDETGALAGLYGGAVEIHAQKEAEGALRETDRRKDEFLAMLAHELRNPLTPIANSVELLKIARPDDAQVARIGEMVGRQTTILTRIVDDLLDVSRITTGKITLQKVPVDLGLIARDAADAVKPLVASRWQTLDVIISATVEVAGDPMRLMQVISNLLNNAAKYSPENASIRLTIERDGNDAVVRVCDTGYGIAADLLPHVFDLFTQAERTPDRSQGGLGIGLTVVRKLIELHGGRVEARSEGIGRGSEFIVRLPAIIPSSKTALISNEASVPRPSPVKVLVVDDNPDCADSMAELLRLRGFDTDIARDGAAAIERFRRYRPNVVLLDIGLPDMDGHAVARRIREIPESAHTTLIAVTGYGQAKDRANSKAAGFDQHMVKPVDFAKLIKMIKAATHSSALLPQGNGAQ